MSRKLENKVAIVTGASKGIGAAISKALAAEGAAVVVNYSSSREAADKVVADITAVGGRAIAVQANVSKQEEIERLFAETSKAFGRLDVLVNNAGIYVAGPIGTITEESFHQHFNLNVLGLILASQEALKYFGAEGGTIVNVSSVVAKLNPPGITVYCATKGAVDAVTRSFSRELADRKIRVNSVNPGLIATEGVLPDSSPRIPRQAARWVLWASRRTSRRLWFSSPPTTRAGSTARCTTQPAVCSRGFVSHASPGRSRFFAVPASQLLSQIP
jgi:3-oxoacyl-[acyl-carrier protein] reductase